MPFEILDSKDMDEAKAVWAGSFGDEQGFIDHYFSVRVPPGHVFGLRDGGSLASILCAVPMRCKIRDSHIQTAFITGVSTLPEQRGKGFISQLFSGVMPHLKEMGYALALLSPAVQGMYEKYGFSYCTKKRHLTLTRSAAEQMAQTGNGAITISSDTDISALAFLYGALSAQSSCIPERTGQDWAFILDDLEKDRGGILTAWDKEKPSGYMAYRYEDGSLESPESIFADAPVFYLLANEILQMGKAAACAFTFQPAATEIPDSILEQGGMARILDMEAVTSSLKDGLAGKGQVCIEIRDPLCPWNDGVFEFGKSGEGSYHIQRSDLAPEIKMPIGEWTEWICGNSEQSEDRGSYGGKIADTPEALAKILPKKNCICFDKY